MASMSQSPLAKRGGSLNEKQDPELAATVEAIKRSSEEYANVVKTQKGQYELRIFVFDSNVLHQEGTIPTEVASMAREHKTGGITPGQHLPPGWVPLSAEVGDNGRTYVVATRLSDGS